MMPDRPLLSYPEPVANWIREASEPSSGRSRSSFELLRAGVAPDLPRGFGANRSSRARIALGLAPNPWKK